MRARLLTTPEDRAFMESEVAAGRLMDPVFGARLWPAGAPIPEGWEEVGIVSEPPFRGTTMQEARARLGGELELCHCGHDRRSHIRHADGCLVRRNKVVCDCMEFEGAA